MILICLRLVKIIMLNTATRKLLKIGFQINGLILFTWTVIPKVKLVMAEM